jgi:hypothetical protein
MSVPLEDETLVSLEEAKQFLQIPSAVTTNDDLITAILLGVESAIQANLKSTILTTETVEYLDGGATILRLANIPIDDSEDILVEDTLLGVEVDSTFYSLLADRGVLMYNGTNEYNYEQSLFYSGSTNRWPDGERRYKVTYTGGLGLRTDYARVVAQIKIAEMLWLSDFYSHRQASTSDEKVDVFEEIYELKEDIPSRVKSALTGLLYDKGI